MAARSRLLVNGNRREKDVEPWQSMPLNRPTKAAGVSDLCDDAVYKIRRCDLLSPCLLPHGNNFGQIQFHGRGPAKGVFRRASYLFSSTVTLTYPAN